MKPKEVVAGFRFEANTGPQTEFNGMICEIVSREGTDVEQLDEPRFLVVFGDGTEVVANAHELTPWFPT